jgi:hypothetical protein
MNRKQSENIVISAPMSFNGSAQRIFKITNVDNQLLIWLLLVPLSLLLTLTAWSFVLIWYLIFGIWLIPYRLIRCSQRKIKRDNLRHKELLEQIHTQRRIRANFNRVIK